MGVIGPALAVALVVLSIGCSGDDDGGDDEGSGTPATETVVTAPDGGLADPCSLLTSDEIADATGEAFGPAVANAELSTEVQAICDWSAEGGSSTVQVIVSGDVYESNRVGAEEVGEDLVDLEVDGADAAFSTFAGGIVAMDVDGAFVQVSYLTDTGDDVTEVTVSLAEAAVGRL